MTLDAQVFKDQMPQRYPQAKNLQNETHKSRNQDILDVLPDDSYEASNDNLQTDMSHDPTLKHN